MLAPVLLLLAFFVCGLAGGIVQSFGVLKAAGLYGFTLQYYKAVFSQPDLLLSIRTSLRVTGISSAAAVVSGILLSAVFSRTGFIRSRAYHFFKLPVLIPHTVVAALVINLFSQSGLLARLCFALGILRDSRDFIPMVFDTGFVGVMMGYLWKEIPFIVLVVATVMANIGESLGEAATNLGASRIRAFFHVTLPLCLPSAALSFIMVFTYSFGAYELPLLLGPTSPRALPVQAYVEYTNPDLAHRPYAMVLNTLMVVTGIVFTALYFRLMKNSFQKAEVRPYD